MTKQKKSSSSSNKMGAYVWLIFLLKQLSIGMHLIQIFLTLLTSRIGHLQN